VRYRDPLPQVDFRLERESRFSYVCNACRRCCYRKGIRVGPYELLRLARRLGVTTTEVIARHTAAGGTVLQNREGGGCVFLGAHGCTVHPDRPLVCRVYPLARWVDSEGKETFGNLEPHPQTAGVYGTGGTVDDYLVAQGAATYFAMIERYHEVYTRMVRLLERLAPDEAERRGERRTAVDEMDAGSLASSFMDVDATVAAYCLEHSVPVPAEIDGVIELHLRAVRAWLDAIEPAPSRSPTPPKTSF
jgi:Fe-S-cluster containining protein